MDPFIFKIVHAVLLPLFFVGIFVCVWTKSAIKKKNRLLIGLFCSVSCLLFLYWAYRDVDNALMQMVAEEASKEISKERSMLVLQVLGVNLLPVGLIGCAVCLGRHFSWKDLASPRVLWLFAGVAGVAGLLGVAYLATEALLY